MRRGSSDVDGERVKGRESLLGNNEEGRGESPAPAEGVSLFAWL